MTVHHQHHFCQFVYQALIIQDVILDGLQLKVTNTSYLYIVALMVDETIQENVVEENIIWGYLWAATMCVSLICGP
jgi:fumarate reductase subunit C